MVSEAPTDATELCFATAGDIAGWVRNGEVSARDVMSAHLAQIERVNPQVNAIVTLLDGDELLEKAGTDKSKLLSATIWLSDIGDFDEMNSVWDAWVSPGNAPARACVESALAAPQFNVEIGVIAALD